VHPGLFCGHSRARFASSDREGAPFTVFSLLLMDRFESNVTAHGSSGNSPTLWPAHSSVRIHIALNTSRQRPNQDFSLQQLQRIASQRGGECLASRYLKTMSPLRWRCAFGHQWQASLASIIRRNTWCPACAGNRKLELKDLCKLARERGGKCLSREYLNGRTPLTWECSHGHKWRAAAEQVKGGLFRKGTWCPRCYDRRRTFRPAGTIEQMRSLASSRGGTCMSPNYLGSRAKLLWRCGQGHRWFAVPGNIKRGNWCPVCAGNRRLNLKDYRALAAKHGGKCLSRRYKNNDIRLRWRCAKGHEWFATGSSVMRGSWCARCAHTRRMGSLRRKPGHL
jgi:hypothetical protein